MIDVHDSLYRRAAALAAESARVVELLAGDLELVPVEAARLLVRLDRLARVVEDVADTLTTAVPATALPWPVAASAGVEATGEPRR